MYKCIVKINAQIMDNVIKLKESVLATLIFQVMTVLFKINLQFVKMIVVYM